MEAEIPVGINAARTIHSSSKKRGGRVLKKRLTDFEKTLRELEITRYGIKVSRPFPHLRGILGNVPQIFENGSAQP